MPITAGEYLLERKRKLIKYFRSKKICDCNYIGIDRSLTATGISVIKNGKILESGVIKSKHYGPLRLIDISNQLITKIMKYENPVVCMEAYALGAARGKNPGRAFDLGEIGGVLKSDFTKHKIYYLEIDPGNLKKYVTGKGNTNKALMPMFVNKKFGFESKSGDEADAVGCGFFVYHAFCYINDIRMKFTIPEKESFETFFSLEKKLKKKSANKKNKDLALEVAE